MTRMSTTCPNCLLHLAVTPADLRVGQGYVRCGRCQRVFNALVSLAEDEDSGPVFEEIATGTSSVPALGNEAAAQEVTGQQAPAQEPPAGEAPASLPAVPAVPDNFDVVESVGTGTFETIVLEGSGATQTEEHVDAAVYDHELQRLADRIEADRRDGGKDEEELFEFSQLMKPVAAAAPAPATLPADVAADPDAVPGYEVSIEEPAAAPLHWGWKLAAAVLALALLGQLVHHFRHSLIARSWAAPVIGPAYAAFGAPLEPRWDLDAYDVRQLGGEAPPGTADKIVVRASVLNRAGHAQPPPVLRVTLQDRYGNALATHDVAPQDYLRSSPPSRLPPDQRLDAELFLDDPGSRAAGFELDACLPAADGRLYCAGAR